MWYLSFGWKENPFSIKTSTELVGLEEKRKELINYVLSGDICFLNGPTGVGKTSLLKWLEKNLKNHKVIYIDAAGVTPHFSLTDYLRKQNSFIGRLTGKDFPKNTVVLLDESQDCDEELVKALKLHWDHNHIKSIVITQINPNLDGFSESFKHRIGKRVVVVGKLSQSQGHDLINLRAKDKNPFDKSAIETILELSDYIPRRILESCEIVCAKTAGKKLSINAFDVEKALFSNKIEPITNLEDNSNLFENQDFMKKPILNQLNDKLSPMERRILNELTSSEKTTQELTSSLATSEGSIGKQLSKLMRKNLVTITKQDRPKKYGLVD